MPLRTLVDEDKSSNGTEPSLVFDRSRSSGPHCQVTDHYFPNRFLYRLVQESQEMNHHTALIPTES